MLIRQYVALNHVAPGATSVDSYRSDARSFYSVGRQNDSGLTLAGNVN